jgi:hypothetical protein
LDVIAIVVVLTVFAVMHIALTITPVIVLLIALTVVSPSPDSIDIVCIEEDDLVVAARRRPPTPTPMSK